VASCQVIETSGVTAPEALISLLDQRFGKMTRARLDSVITVVDAEALHALATSTSTSTSTSSANETSSGSGSVGVDPAAAIAANLPRAMRSQIQVSNTTETQRIP
jgi:G3E family GTPase